MLALLYQVPRSGWKEEQEHDKKETAESLAGVEGEGGDCCLERRQDAGRVGPAIRCASDPDHGLEAPVLEHAVDVFSDSAQKVAPVDLVPLHAKIVQLTLENDFLEDALTKAGLLSAKR